MNLKVRVGLLFAGLGYAIVIAIGLLEMNLNVHAPTMLIYMGPVLILISRFGDKSAAKEIFAQLGDSWDQGVWTNLEMFQAAKTWAAN